MKITRLLIATSVAALFGSMSLAAEFRVGLQDDVDSLDPAVSSTYVTNVVDTSLCEKLIGLAPDLSLTPLLAEKWSWSDDHMQLRMKLREDVTFHDDTPFNAEAVVANIERYLTMPESRRRVELASVASIEATGPFEVLFKLKSPDATLLSQFTTQAGVMVSPTAVEKQGANFANHPVCTGPYQFESRVPQDRIVLKKFEKYREADRYHFDTLTFLPIPDSTVRLANLRAGQLDMVERLAPSDVGTVRGDSGLALASIGSIAYQALTINLRDNASGNNPMGQDARVRQAFSLAIDRKALSDIVFAGTAIPGNQPMPPSSPWYASAFPVPARDIDKAKALLKEAGVERVKVTVQVPNNPVQLQMMQVVQSMVAEAGFDLSLQSMEFASMLAAQNTGEFQIGQIGWTGRVDPDGNIRAQVTCAGGPLNDAAYCNKDVDTALQQAKETFDDSQRKALYDKVTAQLSQDLPIIYLYHPAWIWALKSKVKGFQMSPSGMFNLKDVTREE